jgi:hypothetical protein
VVAAARFAVVGQRRLGQRNAERATSRGQRVEVGDISFREQALHQRLKQRQPGAQALDAAIEALLARLRGQARDVVHDAVPTRRLSRLFPALLLARLALVARCLGALPLVERDSARRGAGRGRGRGGGRHGGLARHVTRNRTQALQLRDARHRGRVTIEVD